MNFCQLYLRVLAKLGPHRRLGWFLAFANVALAGAMFAEPILYGRVIDALTRGSNTSTAPIWQEIWPLIIYLVIFGVFTIMCSTLVAWLADRLAHQRRHAVFAEYYEHVLNLSMLQRSQTHTGRLMKVMLQGTDTLWWLWLSFFREQLAAIVVLLVLMPLALYINWRLGLVLLTLCVLFGVLTHAILRKTQYLQQKIEGHHSDLAELAADTLSNIAVVQSFTRVQSEVRALDTISQRVLGAQLPVLTWWALVTVLTRSATTVSILCIIILGVWLHSQSLISTGEIVTFIAFSGMVIGRLEQVIAFSNRLAADVPRLQEFFGVLDTTPDIQDSKGALDHGRVQGCIEFENVSFSYQDGRPAVERLSFKILPGQTLALVGVSGAGKSTALRLLYRALDPQLGNITIDGINIKEFTLQALRRNIGVVFQDTMLFNRSIAENLRVGSPAATDADILKACERAQALDFIQRQAAGFQELIGEQGRSLSGGERQRLAIARVLLKDPPILIFDEATSALDSQTETQLLQAIAEVTHQRSTLIIAHRLSTIRQADMILVMDSGTVIACGNFADLYKDCAQFATIVQQQFNSPIAAATIL